MISYLMLMLWFAVRSCSRTRVGLSCSISVQLSLTQATNHYHQGQTYSGVFCENSGHCLLWDSIFFFFVGFAILPWFYFDTSLMIFFSFFFYFFYYCWRDVYVLEHRINTIKGTFRNVRCFSTCELIKVFFQNNFFLFSEQVSIYNEHSLSVPVCFFHVYMPRCLNVKQGYVRIHWTLLPLLWQCGQMANSPLRLRLPSCLSDPCSQGGVGADGCRSVCDQGWPVHPALEDKYWLQLQRISACVRGAGRIN